MNSHCIVFLSFLLCFCIIHGFSLKNRKIRKECEENIINECINQNKICTLNCIKIKNRNDIRICINTCSNDLKQCLSICNS